MTIPFSLPKDNHIHLQVNLNHGPNLDFIFDTGADTCVLTEIGRSKMSQLRFDGHSETLGSGGTTDQLTVSNVDITLAGCTWSKQTLMFIDYKGALPADGVIGYNLFSQNVIGLDFNRSILTAWNKLPISTAHLLPVEVTVRDGLAFIPVKLNSGSSQITAEFAVDTGFGGTATIAAPTARTASLPGNLEQSGSGKMGGTGNGSIAVTRVRLPMLSIGGKSIANAPIDVQLSESPSFKTWNIVGCELLRRLNITWDIPHHKMYFAKNSQFAVTFSAPPSRREKLSWVVGCVALFVACLALIQRYRSSRSKSTVAFP